MKSYRIEEPGTEQRANTVRSFETEQRRWTDIEEELATLDSQSIAYYSEQAIRALRVRSSAPASDVMESRRRHVPQSH